MKGDKLNFPRLQIKKTSRKYSLSLRRKKISSTFTRKGR